VQRLHIALYHDAVIPPAKYGGTERIVYWLARALTESGHRVTLLARPGSSVPGVEVISLRSNDWERMVPDSVDLVHLWSTPGSAPSKPFVVTIQGNGKPGEKFHPNTIFISKKHAENHSSTCFVHNGIDPAEYFCDSKRDDFLVFLAKASWQVKNLSAAIEIARAAEIRLEVMGSRDWPLRLHRLLPAWKGVHYRGMVGDAEKRQVLRRARGLLFPVRWHEPFGIAVTEALASGCPVYATPYGSLPEIVTPDTGALSLSSDELLAAVQNGRFSPERCRARVYEGFTYKQMTEKYLAYYRTVLESGRLNETSPVSTFMQAADIPLPYSYGVRKSVRYP
jgi:hypothetical protein